MQSIIKDAEYQLNLKGKLSEKQRLNMRLAEIYNVSNSKQSFLKALENKAVGGYSRNGKIAGLQGDKRRYRLKTLGFSKERLEELNLAKSRRIVQLNRSKSKDRDIDLER